MCVYFLVRELTETTFSDKMFLIGKCKCLEAVRIDVHCLSKPLPLQSGTQTTQMVYSTPVLLFFMKALKKFVAFQLKSEVGWESNLRFYSLSRNTFTPFLYQKRVVFTTVFYFQLEVV